MPNQTGKNILVAYKAESTFNVAPTASGATRFRPNSSAGLSLKKATISPNEVRSDLKTSMARHGSREVTGSYVGDISTGTFDPLFEAVLRGTQQASFTYTQATGTNVTAAAGPPGVFTFAAGSLLTAGVRVGDVVRMNATGGPAGNNNRNLRVTAVTALTLSVAETLTLDATPRTTFVLTIAKKVTQPVAPVNRSFTFEEYYTDIDLTEQFTGCRISSMKISGPPNGMATVEFGIVGANETPLTTGTSPFYTTPTLSSTLGLVMADATLRFGGVDIATLSSVDLMLDNRFATLPVIGSTITPDVFGSSATLSGTISGTRPDFTQLNNFINETELELQILLVAPMSEPKDFISIYIPRLKIMSADTPIGSDGALIETLQFVAGDKEVVTGYDDTMISVITSAP